MGAALAVALLTLGTGFAAAPALRLDEEGVPLLPMEPLRCGEGPGEAPEARGEATPALHLRGRCRDGLAEGGWTASWDQGGKAWNGWFEAGFPDGRFKSWYPDGARRAWVYLAAGQRDGLTVLWWEGGRLRAVERYEQGLAQGCHTRWRQDGRLESRGAWLDGVAVARWLRWDEGGARSVETLPGEPRTGRCFRWLLP